LILANYGNSGSNKIHILVPKYFYTTAHVFLKYYLGIFCGGSIAIMDKNSKKVTNVLKLISILIVIFISSLILSANFVPSKYLKDFSEHPEEEILPHEVLREQTFSFSDRYVLSTGETFKLPDNYNLIPRQIDVEGKKAWLEVSRNGDFVDDQVLAISDDLGSGWDVYSEDGNELMFRIYLNDVSQKIDSVSTESVCVIYIEMM